MENFSPQIIKRVAKELQELSSSPPEGIKVFTSDDDITNIQATIEGPGLNHQGPVVPRVNKIIQWIASFQMPENRSFISTTRFKLCSNSSQK